MRLALRTQQVIAHETGVANTIDPLGGSYYIEALTDQMEEAAYDYFRRIDEIGGMVEAVKQNFPQREIADSSFIYQQEVDSGKRIIVGVNAFTEGDDEQIPILRIDPALERKQIGRLQAVRARRSGDEVEAALARLREVAAGDGNLMDPAARMRTRTRVRGRDRRVAAAGLRLATPRRRSSSTPAGGAAPAPRRP